jgi:hypothetical protein
MLIYVGKKGDFMRWKMVTAYDRAYCDSFKDGFHRFPEMIFQELQQKDQLLDEVWNSCVAGGITRLSTNAFFSCRNF